jgi:hypothetical protein
MRSLIIYHHLGLGDHIICNGLVRYLAQNNKVILICKNKNINNVNFMYRDNTNISTQPVDNDYEADYYCNSQSDIDVLRVGFAVGGKKFSDCLWDENFYRNANVNFEYSWSRFYIEPDMSKTEKLYASLNPKNEPYIFIHNIDSTNSDRIDYSIIDRTKKIIITDRNIDFFDYCSIIYKALEIHCIDSSFKHLIDRIPTTGQLFYHKLRLPKPYDNYTQKKNWTIV